MEVFTGDHGLPNDVVLFTDTHLTPFSLPTNDNTDDHHFLPPPPPQKLRPIRCNGRPFSDCCSSDDPLKNPIKPSNLGVLSSKQCQIEPSLSSSSDESSKLQEGMNEPVNKKKRKRKSRKKLESFIESMMRTVIQKQEEMHKQLIDMFEKKETERIVREEAWKQQEVEKAKKNEEARAQEISRSIALIAFIQNSLGQEIQIPKGVYTSNLDKQTDDNQNEEHLKNDQEMIVYDPSGNVEESECDSSVKRWPKSEVQALITVRAALNQKFNGKGMKGLVWEEVAAGLSGMGYNRTPKKCKEKWENINKYYRRTMEKGKESGTGMKSSQVCTYFTELETLYKNGFVSGNTHDEDQTTKTLH